MSSLFSSAAGTMAPRKHIIYAHPADTDGFSYFYLYYFPGDEQVSVRYCEGASGTQEFSLPPVAMLDWLQAQTREAVAGDTRYRAWDRALKALRTRLRQWLAEAER